ncbi:Scr1 family TA system antitoxin-like transcriptional regulator [Streptomyces sp. NPDC002602]|uniref:Scr1 family TA system antitoxin-like transcriptional regulator n=1 Tax=Streptomyces sp. NPDC002602 TaxID=3364654 RepID=UPI003682C4C5
MTRRLPSTASSSDQTSHEHPARPSQTGTWGITRTCPWGITRTSTDAEVTLNGVGVSPEQQGRAWTWRWTARPPSERVDLARGRTGGRHSYPSRRSAAHAPPARRSAAAGGTPGTGPPSSAPSVFSRLETSETRRLAYSEGRQNGRPIAAPNEVSFLQQRYDTLRSQALNPKESRGLLEGLRGDL